MVMHVAEWACLHVRQNRSHITLCKQTSFRHCLIEHSALVPSCLEIAMGTRINSEPVNGMFLNARYD